MSEAAKQAQLLAWIAGTGPIAAHSVTFQRLNAIGVFGDAARKAFAFAQDRYNYGVDKGLTHEDRLRNRDMA
jgi:hypothetical protein